MEERKEESEERGREKGIRGRRWDAYWGTGTDMAGAAPLSQNYDCFGRDFVQGRHENDEAPAQWLARAGTERRRD